MSGPEITVMKQPSSRAIRTGIMLLLFWCAMPSSVSGRLSDRDRGNLEYLLGNYEKALESYVRVLEEEGRDPEIQFNLGCCLLELDEPRKAAGFFESALEAFPGDRGMAAILSRAEEEYESSVEYLLDRGQYFCAQGRYEMALYYLQTAIERSPRDRVILSNLRDCYIRLGQWDRADMIVDYSMDFGLNLWGRGCYVSGDDTSEVLSPFIRGEVMFRYDGYGGLEGEERWQALPIPAFAGTVDLNIQSYDSGSRMERVRLWGIVALIGVVLLWSLYRGKIFSPVIRGIFKRYIRGKDLSWLVKILKERRYSGVLEVTSRGQRGHVYFDNGSLIGARMGGFEGIEAMVRLSAENEGDYFLRDGRLRREKTMDVPREDIDEKMRMRREKIRALRARVLDHPERVRLDVQHIGAHILKGIEIRESRRKILRELRREGGFREYVAENEDENNRFWEEFFSLVEEGYVIVSAG